MKKNGEKIKSREFKKGEMMEECKSTIEYESNQYEVVLLYFIITVTCVDAF